MQLKEQRVDWAGGEREGEGVRKRGRERQATAAQTVVAGEGGACSLPEVEGACDVLPKS